MRNISCLQEMNTEELLHYLSRHEISERDAITILRSPFCTAEVASKLMENHRNLSAHRVRELLCQVGGMPTPTLMDLISTLPWLSLVHLAQDARTPPVIRRRAERRLLQRIPRLSLGERIALARRCHRELFLSLFDSGDEKIIEALLSNPRMTEADLSSAILRLDLPPSFYSALIRHPKWSCRRGLRMVLARNPATPLPLALSALAELGLKELETIRSDRATPERVRDAATDLMKRRKDTGNPSSPKPKSGSSE